MKRGTLRKKSKQSISLLQRKLWEECRRICGKIYANPDGSVDCYTCGAKDLQGSNRQLGHLWAKASLGAYLKYDLRVLRWQDYRCNINFGGNSAVFYQNMIKLEGQDYVDKLIADKNITVKAYDFYLELLEKYAKL